ncbi:MAG: iron-sulfur cluster assembly accessory protein [Candidatus Sericytochromatia bacterium]|nr:iron-sulfur cluster assembly accessory protein [Candidatus Sericytochromatia bacterium]
MTTESRPNTKSLVTLTPRAAEHVKTLFERKGLPDAFLRVAVAGGGCSGMSYKLDVATEPGATDRIIPSEGGVRVLVDVKSALYIAGIVIDYDDDLMNAGFKFINPNAKTSCGCGESFST